MNPNQTENKLDKWKQYQAPTEKNRYITESKNEESKSSNRWKDSKAPVEYQPAIKEKEGFLESIPRVTAGALAKSASVVGGYGEDLRSFLEDIFVGGYERATFDNPNREDLMKKQRDAPMWLKNLFRRSDDGTLGSFPKESSQELKEKLDVATGGYTKPRGKSEESIQDLAGGLTLPWLPGGGRANIFNRVAVPLGAQAIKEGMEFAGFDKSTSQKGYIGSYLMLSMISPQGARAHAQRLETEAMNSIPPGHNINLNVATNELAPLHRRFQTGNPRQAAARGQLDATIQNIGQGRHTVADVWERLRAVNDLISERGGFDVPFRSRGAAVRNLELLKSRIKNVLNHVGDTYPEFRTHFENYNRTMSTLSQSNRITDFIGRHWKSAATSVIAPLLGEAWMTGGIPYATIGAATVLPLINRGGQILYRMARNPEFMNLYGNAILGAMNENKNVMVHNLDKLNKLVEEEEEKLRKSKIPDNYKRKKT